MTYCRPFALLALLALGSLASAQSPYVDGDAEAGSAKAGQCAACHGGSGNSTNDEWPNIAGQHALYLYEQLRLYKDAERDNQVMVQQAADLSEQDMKDLAVHFAAQEMEIGGTNEELAELGEKIYRGGLPEKDVPACAACHGPIGQGNPGAGYPRLSGQNAQYTSNTLQAYRSGDRSGYEGSEIMNSIAEGLSDEEIRAVSSFVSGLYVDR